jgi:hypothetical protein
MKAEVIAVQPWGLPVLDFVALAKPRLNVLVVASTAVGYWLGAATAGETLVFLSTVLGTALVAAGASALNQLVERDVDALMRRTRLRPLPDGRLQPMEAGWFAIVTVTGGLFVLALGANLLAAAVSALTNAAALRRYLHTAQATNRLRHSRRCRARRSAADDRLGSSAGDAEFGSLDAVSDCLPLADPALPVHRVDLQS